jgi:hypothetical protein
VTTYLACVLVGSVVGYVVTTVRLRRYMAATRQLLSRVNAAAKNDICGMQCPGGSEQRKCGCRRPSDCVLMRGGQR